MAVAHKWERGLARKGEDKRKSMDGLQAHLDYLEDPTHEDHEGMVLLPGCNYNCPGQARDDFFGAVDQTNKNYNALKDLLGINKRSLIKWEEVIYCLGNRCYHTPEEREAIERRIIKIVCGDAPARATWHMNPETGDDDLHIVFAAQQPNGRLTLEHCIGGFSMRVQQELDQYAADLLNSSPNKPLDRLPYIQTAKEAAEENKKEAALEAATEKEGNEEEQTASEPTEMQLHEQVALQAEKEGITDVEAHHLPGLLERIGLKIREIIGDIIRYKSSRTKRKGYHLRVPRTGVIRIHDFLIDVLSAQIDIRLKRSRETSKAETSPELSPGTPEPIPELTAKPAPQSAPETPEAPVGSPTTNLPDTDQPKKKPAKSPETIDKAALLLRYLEAALGLKMANGKKAKQKEIEKLAEATKGMFKKNGTIRASVLKNLPDEQRDTLIKLAADLLMER